VVTIGLMGETNSSSNVEASDLAEWDATYDWDDYANIYSVDDGGYINASPYSVINAIPFTWIIDENQVVRFKLVGYGTISGQGIVNWVVEQLLAEMD
jgi:hypothetical protein